MAKKDWIKEVEAFKFWRIEDRDGDAPLDSTLAFERTKRAHMRSLAADIVEADQQIAKWNQIRQERVNKLRREMKRWEDKK